VIAIDDFARVQLRCAKVLVCERHPNAEKLLRLEVDLGGETRQLVAGIASAYRPEELVGRTIIVVANLKPAKLRGLESQGMLLAATGPDGLPHVLGPDGEVPPGSKVS
jgi:methionyl-tRNA synthetase